MKQFLIVDADPDFCDVVGESLQKHFSCEIRTAGSVGTALQIISQANIDLVVSSLKLPDGSGTSISDFLLARDVQDCDFILFTGSIQISALSEKMVVVEKPNFQELTNAIEFILSIRN